MSSRSSRSSARARLLTNREKLVRFAVQGQVMPPTSYGWEVTHDGRPVQIPSVGGITYNVKIGDSAFDWVGDHIEPGVSSVADRKETKKNPNTAYNAFSCIGNRAMILTGAAKGKTGTVTGHHGGVEHVLLDFDDGTLAELSEDDKIKIEAFGSGLSLLDYPTVALFALDPDLFDRIPIEARDDKLYIPVAGVVPPELMGSGLGSFTPYKGDYDIQTSDETALREAKLRSLKLGDLVAIRDHDATYGYCYRRGAWTIGVVIHASSSLAGHGPGVQAIMTSSTGQLQPFEEPKSNIGAFLRIGRYRRAS